MRCPEGREKQCFYHKHASGAAPIGLRTIDIDEMDERAPYFVLRGLAGVISLVQMGVLEIHLCGCRTDRLERPDRMVFDLDPGDDVPWSSVVEVARRLRDLLAEMELVAFLETTGGKGLHLVVPIERRTGWNEVRAFARAVAEALAQQHPDVDLTSVSKAKRAGKILIDTLRNARGSTWVAPYSTCARAAAPLSMPIAWSDLSDALRSDAFRLVDEREGLTRRRVDPWRELPEARQRPPRSPARF